VIHRILLPLPREAAVNVWVLRGEPLTLVDTGPAGSAPALAALEAGLADLDLRVEDLQLVLLTHHHADHTGLAAAIRARSGAVLAAHETLAGYLERFREHIAFERAFFGELLPTHGVPDRLLGEETGFWRWLAASADEYEVDRRLGEGELVRGGGRDLRVLLRPGHSATDTLFVDDVSGLAFVGDHLLTTPAYAELGPIDGGPRRPALVRYLANLRKLAEEPLGTAHTGHGDDVLDHRAAIAARLEVAERRCGRIEELLGEAPLTAFELSKRLWGEERVEWDPTIAVSDVVGHLDILLERGAVATVEEGDLCRFQRAP
jgi:glyoxylase-like metal-dependent hydrolase (beta-lactamase superfamily II)